MVIGIGDYVIGVDGYVYTITNHKCLCKVIGIGTSGDTIILKVAQEDSSHKGRLFEVDAEYFKVVKKYESTPSTTAFKEGDVVKYNGRVINGKGGNRSLLNCHKSFDVVYAGGNNVVIADKSPFSSQFIIHADYLRKVICHNDIE